VAVVYFFLASTVSPRDPKAGLSFVRDGNLAGGLWFSGVTLMFAALVGAVTVFIRPSGAMVVLLIGAGGLSVRSGPIRPWLWHMHDNLPAMYGGLILELLLGAVVLLLGSIILDLIRRLVGAVRPAWLWRHKNPQGQRMDAAGSFLKLPGSLAALVKGVFQLRSNWSIKKRTEPKDAVRALGCLTLTCVTGFVLVMLLAQSPNRGQILFALAASFFLAVLIGLHVSPTKYGSVVFAAPVLVGVLMYILGAVTSVNGSAMVWTKARYYAQALPIDWLFAGGAGAMLGCFIWQRKQEADRVQKSSEDV
jgi:hypothetical protein